jgi:cytochrome c-type biogenesis protein CcmH/NrfG
MTESKNNETPDEQDLAKLKFGKMFARGFIKATQKLGTEHIHRMGMVGDFSLDANEEQSLRESLRKKSKDPYGWWLLGHTLLKREEFDEAKQCLDKAVKQYKEAPYVWRDLGILYKRIGEVDKAREALVNSLELDIPNVYDPETLFELAGVLMYDEEFTEALKVLEVQKQQTPEDIPMWLHIGHCFLRLDFVDEAFTVYEWIVSKDPSNFEAWSNLGYLYCAHYEWEKAEKALRRANQLRPNDYDVLMNFGAMFRMTNQPQAAVKAYRKAVKIQPNNARPWQELGKALRENGKFDESHEAYARALEIEPESESAAAGMLNTEHARKEIGLES